MPFARYHAATLLISRSVAAGTPFTLAGLRCCFCGCSAANAPQTRNTRMVAMVVLIGPPLSFSLRFTFPIPKSSITGSQFYISYSPCLPGELGTRNSEQRSDYLGTRNWEQCPNRHRLLP